MKNKVITFYKFVLLSDCDIWQQKIYDYCKSLALKGTFLIAKEGINATISGNAHDIDSFVSWLTSFREFTDLYVRCSDTQREPFRKLKVKVKDEIVTMGVDDVHPDMTSGIHVDPQNWNDILKDDEFVVLDVRNDYETAIGGFTNHTDPTTQIFSEFPDYVKCNLERLKAKKVAMYCTGGIRCEKASSYMLSLGFKEIYQLKGGIVSYLQAGR